MIDVKEVRANVVQVSVSEQVVEVLIVGVVKAKLLEGVEPRIVDLGEELDVRELSSDGSDGVSPKLGGRALVVVSAELLTPVIANLIVEDEMSHIAADVVGEGSYLGKAFGLGFSKVHIPVVELQGVHPR